MSGLPSPAPRPGLSPQQRRVVVAAALGTVFEWYDFFLYGSLAGIIAEEFFAGLDKGSAYVFALLAFATGFVVRPFGALLFGRLGDMIGRKYTFLVTILLMGMSTFIAGLLPGYADIGIAAPLILVVLRLLQGLALGGEYGGAATYVAEYAPVHRRGAYTSWLQTTATIGLLLALLVNVGLRQWLGAQAFADWGWRLPFLASSALLAVSLWMRLRLDESPAFVRLRREGGISRAPLAEALGRWVNLRRMLIALFGLTAAQGVIWYTGQFYVLIFLTHTLKVDGATANSLIGLALLVAIPFFWIFGRLSDSLGRKRVMLTGCALAAVGYIPLFHALTQAANPGLAKAMREAPVVLAVSAQTCSVLLPPPLAPHPGSACDLARAVLGDAAVDFRLRDAPGPAQIQIGSRRIAVPDVSGMSAPEQEQRRAALAREFAAAAYQAGYPSRADPAQMHKPWVMLILVLLAVNVAMVYGPIAAALAELFPTRIRYTSVGLPYNIGNGWFGGMLPSIGFALVAHNGSIYQGLWYPVLIAGAGALLGAALLPDEPPRALD